MLCDPSTALGVPTQTMTSSESATSGTRVVCAVINRLSRAREISSSTPGSVIGDRPSRSALTFVSFGSIPITSCPWLARHAAAVVPTYPRPKIAIFMSPDPRCRRPLSSTFPSHYPSLVRCTPSLRVSGVLSRRVENSAACVHQGAVRAERAGTSRGLGRLTTIEFEAIMTTPGQTGCVTETGT